MKDLLPAILCGLALLPSQSEAQSAPPAINYQGRLTQATGVVVPDGPTGLRVRIFATASGGTALWDSGDLSVATKSGTFSILLGSGGMPAISPILFALGTVYIEVQPLGQAPLLPRQPIASVPWSLYAQTVSDGAITATKLAPDSASLAKVSGGALTLNGSYLHLGEWPLGEQFLMTIRGNSQGNNSSIPGLYVMNTGGQAYLALDGNSTGLPYVAEIGLYDRGANKSWALGMNSSTDLYIHNPAGDKVTLKQNGRVGIGTNDPQDLLDVNGGIRSSGPLMASGTVIAQGNPAINILGVNSPSAYPQIRFFEDGGYIGRLAATSEGAMQLEANRINLYGSIVASGQVSVSDSTPEKAGPGNTWTVTSDLRLKKHIKPLENVLDELLSLRGVTYEYRDPANGTGRYPGFIAQEVQRVFPAWVSQGSDGYLRVASIGFEALTVEALREQETEIRSLKAENQRLKREITAIWAELKKRR